MFCIHNRENGGVSNVRNLTRFNFSRVAIDDTKDGCLACGAASANTMRLAADVGFVYFNLASEWVKVFGKNIAYSLAHSPSSLISNAGFALDLFCTNTTMSLRHEIDHVEPNGERSRRFMEYSIGSRRDIETAITAGVRLAPVVFVEQAILATLRAINTLRIFLVAHIIQTSIVVREHCLEVFEGNFGHRAFLVYCLVFQCPRV